VILQLLTPNSQNFELPIATAVGHRQSPVANRQSPIASANRQSPAVDHQSALGNPSIFNRHSATANLRFPHLMYWLAPHRVGNCSSRSTAIWKRWAYPMNYQSLAAANQNSVRQIRGTAFD
jgi:hypothetical protein